MATAAESPADSWPTWTPDVVGTTAVDVQIGWSVDETFEKLWGPSSEFSAHVREARNIKNYCQSRWMKDSELFALISANADIFSTEHSAAASDNSGEYAGCSRKVTFSQEGSGGLLKNAYTNTEVQQCIEATKGDKYVMHCTIATTAPYGERFRIVLKYILEAGQADGSNCCHLQILYGVVYVKPTNWGLKSMISSGVDMGVRKNFSTLRELLSELVTVVDVEPDSAEQVQAGMQAKESSLPPGGTPSKTILGYAANGDRELQALLFQLADQTQQRFSALGYVGHQLCGDQELISGFWHVLCSLGYVFSYMDVPDNSLELASSVVLLAIIQKAWTLALAQVICQESASDENLQEIQEAQISAEVSVEGQIQGADAAKQSYGTVSALSEAAMLSVQQKLQNLKFGWKDISSSVMDLAASSSSMASAATRSLTKRSEDNAESDKESANESSHEPNSEILPHAVVYENERYQPIRGWGHTWPGHFLPRDFRHWSDLKDRTSMTFREIYPDLPPGYIWTESAWHLDLSGQKEDSVDSEGWSYAMMWNRLTDPPQAGSGNRKGAFFVRRRKWLRAWMPGPSSEAGSQWDLVEPPAVSVGLADAQEGGNAGKRLAATGASVTEMLQPNSSKPTEQQEIPLESAVDTGPGSVETSWKHDSDPAASEPHARVQTLTISSQNTADTRDNADNPDATGPQDIDLYCSSDVAEPINLLSSSVYTNQSSVLYDAEVKADLALHPVSKGEGSSESSLTLAADANYSANDTVEEMAGSPQMSKADNPLFDSIDTDSVPDASLSSAVPESMQTPVKDEHALQPRARSEGTLPHTGTPNFPTSNAQLEADKAPEGSSRQLIENSSLEPIPGALEPSGLLGAQQSAAAGNTPELSLGDSAKKTNTNSRLGEKLSEAVGRMGTAMAKASESAIDIKEQLRKGRSISQSGESPAACQDPAGTGGLDDSLAWHKRAVSDMRKLAGEVNMENVGGAAQRMSVEMNVAAKKLQGLFDRTKFGFQKAGEPDVRAGSFSSPRPDTYEHDSKED